MDARARHRVLGEGAALAVAGALILAAPAAFRVEPHSALAWVALAAGAATFLAPIVVAVRAARPLGASWLALPLGSLFAAAPVMAFGALLKSATHHRPLGAVTYAVIASACVLVAVAVASRLVSGGFRPEATAARRAARAALFVLGVASLAAVTKLGGSILSAHGGARAGVLDAVTACAVAVVAMRLDLPERWARIARAVGLPLLAVLVVSGAVVLWRSPGVAASARDRAPVVLGPAVWLVD